MKTLRRGDREDEKRRKLESLSYYATDSVKRAKMMMMRKKRAQTGSAGCCQNEDSNHK